MATTEPSPGTGTKTTFIYHSDYGEVPVQKSIEAPSFYTEDLLPTLSRKGMVHEGWYTNANSKVEVNYPIEHGVTTINLYAKWTIERSLVSDYLLYDIADGIRNYFGCPDKELLLEEIPTFLSTRTLSEDILSKAIDTDNSIYNGVGYIKGRRLSSSEGEAASAGHILTGYIPAQFNDQFIIQCAKDYNITYFYAFDSNFTRLTSNYSLISTGHPIKVYNNTMTESEKASVAYIRFTFAPVGTTLEGSDFTIHRVL